MYYIDYHNHTKCSFDSEAELFDTVRAARAAGIREMCVTDHCDLVDENGKRVYSLDWAPRLEQFDRVKSSLTGEDFTLKQGLEFGMGHIDPACADAILNQPRLDFVIGSVHNYSPERGSGDFYLDDMSTPQSCAAILEDYFFSLEQLSRSPYYDILGHIIYPLRYMNGNAVITDWMEPVNQILENVISSGRGIECNTNRGTQMEEWLPVLKRYRELGGEILTVGSDAHVPGDMGKGIPAAYEMLKSLGFSYVCTYEKHKPKFIHI